MNFLRNRLIVPGLVFLATLLLYLLLPSIRQGSMEPSLEAQRMGLMSTSPPPVLTINVSIRTGQLPGDPPLFFREALPVDGAGRQILPRLADTVWSILGEENVFCLWNCFIPNHLSKRWSTRTVRVVRR